MTAILDRVIDWGAGRLRAGESWFVDRKHAQYGASVSRIIYGLVVVLFVLSNLADRDYLWGPASGWVAPIRSFSAWGGPFVFFDSSDPDWLFTLKFLLLGAAGLALMLGWHARIAAIVVLYLYVSLVTTNPVATDQTDNAFRIILFYFVFADMSIHWSLDARRRARKGPSWLSRRLPDWFPTVFHNAAIIAVALQIFIIYVVAGLSKVKGSQWQDGTAVYYPLHLQSLSPWPWLSSLAGSDALLVNIVTYFAVFIQLFFPFLLLTKWTRVIALVGILGMHTGIAILMGLALFSMSMMAADTIFIRDKTWAAVEAWVKEHPIPWLRDRLRLRERIRGSDAVAEPESAGSP